MSSLANLPFFLLYFGQALGLLALFVAIYALVTPCDEWRLIRAGNAAAAVSLAGAALGFALPLAAAIAHAASLTDMLVWGLAALCVQLLSAGIVRLLLRDLWREIANDHMAAAITVASASVITGLLSAACLTP